MRRRCAWSTSPKDLSNKGEIMIASKQGEDELIYFDEQSRDQRRQIHLFDTHFAARRNAERSRPRGKTDARSRKSYTADEIDADARRILCRRPAIDGEVRAKQAHGRIGVTPKSPQPPLPAASFEAMDGEIEIMRRTRPRNSAFAAALAAKIWRGAALAAMSRRKKKLPESCFAPSRASGHRRARASYCQSGAACGGRLERRSRGHRPISKASRAACR